MTGQLTAQAPIAANESLWRTAISEKALPLLNIDGVLQRARTVVVIAAHPDDEVLGVGGLLRQLKGKSVSIRFIWATDGEASHPQSRVMAADQLAAIRRAESAEALARLGVVPTECIYLELPDSGLVDACEDIAGHLLDQLYNVITPDDLIIAPWRGDGHPDHASAGRAAAFVANELGCRLLEYPIWVWHWTTPSTSGLPWDQCLTVALDDADLVAKQAAIAAFVSQVVPIGPAPEDAAIVPPDVVEHFLRPVEVLLR